MTSESRRQRKGENYKRKKDLNERPSNPTRYLHDKDKLAFTNMRGIQDPCEKREGSLITCVGFDFEPFTI